MSSTSTPSSTAHVDRPLATNSMRVPSQPVTLKRATTSEWIKFRTLRSSWLILGAAVLAVIVFAIVIGLNTRHLNASLELSDKAPSGVLQGYNLAQLIVGALGVLLVSGEYGTGMIRSTFTTIPKRVPDLWAKLLVFVAIAVMTMTASSFAGFFVGQAVISSARHAYSLGAPVLCVPS